MKPSPKTNRDFRWWPSEEGPVNVLKIILSHLKLFRSVSLYLADLSLHTLADLEKPVATIALP